MDTEQIEAIEDKEDGTWQDGDLGYDEFMSNPLNRQWIITVLKCTVVGILLGLLIKLIFHPTFYPDSIWMFWR